MNDDNTQRGGVNKIDNKYKVTCRLKLTKTNTKLRADLNRQRQIQRLRADLN